MFTGSAAAAIGANVLVLNNQTTANAGGTITAENGITVGADNDLTLRTIDVTAAGSAGTAAAPVVLVTYVNGTTKAEVSEGADIKAGSGKLSLKANSKEDILGTAVGASGSGGTAVSGAISVIVTKANTTATTGKNAKLSGREIADLIAAAQEKEESQ